MPIYDEIWKYIFFDLKIYYLLWKDILLFAKSMKCYELIFVKIWKDAWMKKITRYEYKNMTWYEYTNMTWYEYKKCDLMGI